MCYLCVPFKADKWTHTHTDISLNGLRGQLQEMKRQMKETNINKNTSMRRRQESAQFQTVIQLKLSSLSSGRLIGLN